MFTSRRTKYALVTVAAASLMLAGCSNSQNDSTSTSESATSAAMTSAAASSAMATEQGVTFTDGYVKAMPEGKTMTGIFGVITNNTDKDINVVSFTSSVQAEKTELHETVDGKMQEKQGGFVIPAGESLTLQPGHEHMMLMGVSTPILAGDTVDVTINLADGQSIEAKALPVRDLAAGNENYGGSGMTEMSGMASMTEMSGMTEMNH